MSKKLFSLIKGGSVHLTPGTKIIPGETISTAMNITEMLSKTKKEIADYRKEVEVECHDLREKAKQEGFQKGLSEWTDQIKHLENQITLVRDEMSTVIIPVALKAAKKIVGQEITLKPKTILGIVKSNLKAVTAHSVITIYLNKKDIDIIEKEREDLKKMFEKLESFTLRERGDIQPGGCVIETEGGIINARLDNLWQTLENAFNTMISSKAGVEEDV